MIIRQQTPTGTVPLATVLWRRLDETSLDYCRLSELPQGYALHGRVLAMHGSSPIEAHYSIFCDRTWRSMAAYVSLVREGEHRSIEVRRNERNEWLVGNDHAAVLDGIEDLDVSITPATNTLPIRRLGLGMGDSQAVDAAWIRFPELTVERLPQVYTRVSERAYRYESRGGAFRAELEVDEAGLVTRYGNLWERVTR